MPLLKLDLHNHSRASRDSKVSVDELIASAIRTGLDGFALTDHDSVAANAEAVRKGAGAGLIVIPGCEISTREGHILALFLEGVAPRGRLRDVLVRIREEGAAAVVSHPLRKGGGVARQDIEDNLDMIDGLEVYNPDNTPFGNRVAWHLASKHGKVLTGGSDTHAAANMGHAVTLVQAEDRSLAGVRRALTCHHTRAAGKHAPPCDCPRCMAYCLLEPIARSRRFQSLPAHDQLLRQTNRVLRQMFFSSGREMRW
jgi:predicted metal-dependent phosphoesterase TrpH